LRKASGLEITDRIRVTLEDRPEIHNAVLHCGEYIASQVLATELSLTSNSPQGGLTGEAGLTSIEMDGYNVQIKIEKA
jgi:isoleucyl-tRNA synthetase